MHLYRIIFEIDQPYFGNTRACMERNLGVAVVVKRRVGDFDQQEYVRGDWQRGRVMPRGGFLAAAESTQAAVEMRRPCSDFNSASISIAAKGRL